MKMTILYCSKQKGTLSHRTTKLVTFTNGKSMGKHIYTNFELCRCNCE